MPQGKRFYWFLARVLIYGAIVLLGVAVALPFFVEARWGSSGVPVRLKFLVIDARTGKPIPNAKTLVSYYSPDVTWPAYEGDGSATTDVNGNSIVHSYFPGTGTGNKARLSVKSTIWVRAEGYEPWRKPSAALLGQHLTVSEPFAQTNTFQVTVTMERK